ncbi:MAG: translation elongation factor EF-1 subunit alpha [Methanosarcina thermophila]|jgi:elongation factor 1-alpha|uniref:Elongation factor 1-alpha n=2 Tax=Methanosarcina thermophila TaxID=2210 RepID=A0A1I6XX64_METTE|nr:translation elongation factor EF-1 subunit alpha [Methanosarcina thermophila]AKB12766.1 Translation elongation factor 1 alpha subunit [Methanosarcina thermophila TM-1]NLU56792.1 translation elongation factor EF-1 subunit alpha [Methanosarcina thermophila]SFT43025.1 translation elongation factor 1A (EF-1A/EF-Tu) [Methanosarcina thermophila]BAW30505.1 elongation factor 1-alpha [Methanosarcina thermophila]HOQ64972.1 translation elongation factor EF-1 subunit alpha [Methanosarcina thermophila]
MAAEKPHLNLAVIGHIDHGKSTFVGRLMYDAGAVPPHIIEKYKEEAKQKGKESFAFAWVMDSLKEERERGITIDIAHKRFDTEKYYFTVVDCPGHRDFVKNMITGASQADAAVLVVAAPDGVMAQTKEHIFLSRTLGINQLIVAINKMDAANYDEKRYKEVVEQVSGILKMIGYKPNEIPFIPISAFFGDNVLNRSDKTPWYNGPTMMEALNNLKEPEKPSNLPLRIPVEDAYTISGIGTVPVGRVETGVMKKGDKVIFMPGGASGEVKSIEMHHEEIPQAVPGDNIGWNVRGIGKNDVRRGDVCGHVDNPPKVADEFVGQIVVLQHPSAITAGYTPVFHAHTAQIACQLIQLNKKLDPKTGQVKEENPTFLKAGDAAIVTIKPTKPMVIEPVKEIPQLGRFAIRDMGMTIAAGMCMSVKQK